MGISNTASKEGAVRPSLPFQEWPEADRDFWSAITQNGANYSENGYGANWRPDTLIKNKRNYGCWLYFLNQRYPETLAFEPKARFIEEHLRHYLEEAISLSPTTQSDMAASLLGMARHLCSEDELSWYVELVRRLYRRAREQRPRPLPSFSIAEIFEAGLKHFEFAVALKKFRPKVRAYQAQEGLLIACLAARPIRRRNFAELELGESLLRLERGYKIVLTGDCTKTHRPYEVFLPGRLSEPLDLFVSTLRPVLLGTKSSQKLWINRNGTPMEPVWLARCVSKTTQYLLGEKLSPHAFRRCAATSIAKEDPLNIEKAFRVLGHTTSANTERYYNLASGIEASKIHRQSVASIREKLRQLASQKLTEC